MNNKIELHTAITLLLAMIVIGHLLAHKGIDAEYLTIATESCKQNDGVKYVTYNSVIRHTVTCVNGGEFALSIKHKATP